MVTGDKPENPRAENSEPIRPKAAAPPDGPEIITLDDGTTIEVYGRIHEGLPPMVPRESTSDQELPDHIRRLPEMLIWGPDATAEEIAEATLEAARTRERRADRATERARRGHDPCDTQD